MAEVHLLLVRPSPEGTRRLAVALTEVIEGGGDLGPREAQIRGLGLSLATLVHALRVELTCLGVAEKLEGPMGTLARLAALASTYQADGLI